MTATVFRNDPPNRADMCVCVCACAACVCACVRVVLCCVGSTETYSFLLLLFLYYIHILEDYFFMSGRILKHMRDDFRDYG